MVSFAAASVAFLAAAAVSAQTCRPAATDLITLQNVPAGGFAPPPGGASQPVDNAQGTYGGEFVNFEFTGGFAKVVPTDADATKTYWFFKFEQRECWDATGYNAFEFDFSGPVGSTFDMTLTVHDASCLTNNCTANAASCTRGPDSTYVPITKYAVPNGSVQHVVAPFADFTPNSLGNGSIDWRYIKDFTFIKFTPVNAEFTFNNFIVKAGCVSAANVTVPTTRPVGLTTGVQVPPGGVATTTAPRVGATNPPIATTAVPRGAASSVGFSALIVSLCIVGSLFASF